jgi:O-antigen/teichoic acid export membrane protein
MVRRKNSLRTGITLARDIAGRLLRPEGGIFAMLHAMAAQGLAMVLNLATGIISARMLGPTGRGEFAALSLWLLLPSLLSIAGIQNAIVYQTGRQPEQAASISMAGFLLSTALFMPMAAICCWWMATPLHAYGPSIISLARVIVVVSVINAWLMIVSRSLLAQRDYRGYNTAWYGTSLAYFLILLVLIEVHGTSPQSFVWAQVAGVAAVLVISTIGLTSAWDWRSLQPFTCIAELAAYSWKAAAVDVVPILIGNLDRLILVGLLSPAMFGMYAVAQSFARILLVLQQAVSAVVLVDLIKRAPAEVELFIHRMFRLLLWALAAFCGILYLFDQWLLGLVYGADFVQAAPIFRILLAEASTACIGQMLIQSFLAAGAPAVPSVVQVVTIGTTAAGMFLLVPRYDAVGAAAALAIASSLRLGLLLGLLRKIGVGLPNPLPRWGDLDPVTSRWHRLRHELPS